VILRVRGLLDTTTADLFDAAVTEIDCAQLSLLVIDLQEVEWLDPVGLSSILRAREWCKETDTALTVIRPRGLVGRFVSLSRALDVLAPCPDPARDRGPGMSDGHR
jgi:anti-anti-sigma factor